MDALRKQLFTVLEYWYARYGVEFNSFLNEGNTNLLKNLGWDTDSEGLHGMRLVTSPVRFVKTRWPLPRSQAFWWATSPTLRRTASAFGCGRCSIRGGEARVCSDGACEGRACSFA